MIHPALMIESIKRPPVEFLSRHGEIFAVYDERTQDSGNISYGINIGNERYFIKTAGLPDDPRPYLSHAERVKWLFNAARLNRSLEHPLLPRLHHVINSTWGPLLVYDWAAGEHIHAQHSQRTNPQSAFQNFLRLPVDHILDVLDGIYDLHNRLAQLGWIAVDFYDGCLIYDFEHYKPSLVDLDMYRQGFFRNEMGRMFGSSRFMSPEEFELNALIDQRSNVYTMGRTALVLLSDGTLDRASFRGSDQLYAVVQRACAESPLNRYQSLTDFHLAWRAAREPARFFPS
jgi:serine/threonine protein kinase